MSDELAQDYDYMSVCMMVLQILRTTPAVARWGPAFEYITPSLRRYKWGPAGPQTANIGQKIDRKKIKKILENK